jgi:hypothetical protein
MRAIAGRMGNNALMALIEDAQSACDALGIIVG